MTAMDTMMAATPRVRGMAQPNAIGDYAMIGDCHSMALVGRDGSIDWLCFPRFNSSSVFARLLDDEIGGHFLVSPAEVVVRVRRQYLPSTNVLSTVFHTDSGRVEVLDCMPLAPLDPEEPGKVITHRAVLRRIRVEAGSVAMRVEVRPRFEYADVVPRFTVTSPGTAEIVGGPDALWLRMTQPLQDEGEALGGIWELGEGDEAWIEAAWTPSHESLPELDGKDDLTDMQERMADTISFWEDWLGRGWYEGDHARKVHRSAMVLKALTYAPTGAVVAAGTTSLPEQVGGERNWDYRFTWIRDATLTLTSLMILGYEPEAAAFKLWLERTGAGRPDDLQIMYGIGGERMLPEIELPHLAGYRNSKPVRVGNGAVKQRQLDSYGQLLEAACLYAKAGGEITDSNWQFLCGLADVASHEWRQPDHGIWEMRDRPRHFIHSKLNCWVALDRALRMVDEYGLPGNVERWTQEREAVHDYLMDHATTQGWFRQAADSNVADASTLLVPALGFLPTAHPLVVETIEVVLRDLSDDGLVHRYLSPDGLAGGEGAFLLCSFWLLDCLTHLGRLEEADDLLDRLLPLANDVGLFSEEVDPSTGQSLGNVPQAFTHMALVTSCAHLSAARRGLLPAPEEAHSYAELALDRLLAYREG